MEARAIKALMLLHLHRHLLPVQLIIQILTSRLPQIWKSLQMIFRSKVFLLGFK